MGTKRQTDPVDHAYTVTLTIRSPQPYTTAEFERLASWWVFVKDRHVKVEGVTVKEKKGRTTI